MAQYDDLQEVLLSAEEIRGRVREMGDQIAADYEAIGGAIVLVGVLKGSLFFLADLARWITRPVEIEMMSVSSYGPSTQSSGIVRILNDLDTSITGRHVLLVEDIVDTGLTLDYLLKTLATRNPASLKVCALLDKPDRRLVDVPIAYCGFRIQDQFVVGYGLDLDQLYRNLPLIGVLRPARCDPS
ncbi:MAG: hypoxanthine phosphoribosyltransferase [Candidatus Latescibacteria bacterium]|nr:hypoxanthine phosphoribosyltransferase [Candidatus Latescibacterota bacterium]